MNTNIPGWHFTGFLAIRVCNSSLSCLVSSCLCLTRKLCSFKQNGLQHVHFIGAERYVSFLAITSRFLSSLFLYNEHIYSYIIDNNLSSFSFSSWNQSWRHYSIL